MGWHRLQFTINEIICLIHQEALCAMVSSLKSTMDVAMKAVNLILSQGFNHRQFYPLLLQAENLYGGFLLCLLA